jgi:hypothetical protein
MLRFRMPITHGDAAEPEEPASRRVGSVEEQMVPTQNVPTT